MRRMIIAAVAGLGLAACQTTTDTAMATQDAGMQLATQSDLAAVTGRTLVHGPGQTIVISADGTVNGSWDGKPIVGTYEMKDGFFCRTLSQAPRGPSPEDCQLMILEGDTLRGTRDRGNGASFSYTVT